MLELYLVTFYFKKKNQQNPTTTKQTNQTTDQRGWCDSFFVLTTKESSTKCEAEIWREKL